MKWMIALLLSASSALADAFPPTYEVTGVAQDDRLNIRVEPNAQSDVSGSFGPYDLNIEVLRTTDDGKWGLVGAGERNGWTAMRFLSQSPPHDPNTLPRPLTCFGNEPFWSLRILPRGDEYQLLGDTRRDLTLISERIAPNGALAVFGEGPTLSRTLIVKRGYCGDGMSDREFALQATLYNDTPDGSSVQSGCCTLDGR